MVFKHLFYRVLFSLLKLRNDLKRACESPEVKIVFVGVRSEGIKGKSHHPERDNGFLTINQRKNAFG